MTYRNLIISQSSSDIVSTLSLINESNIDVIVVCVGSESNHQVYKSLGIENIFIPRASLGYLSLLSIPRDIIRAKRIVKRFPYNFETVTFFSVHFDWLTPILLKMYYASSTIQYCDILDRYTVKEEVPVFRTYRMFLRLYLYLLSGVKYETQLSINSPRFIWQNYDIVRLEHTPSIPTKFVYRLNGMTNVVIFFISKHEYDLMTIKSRELLSTYLGNISVKYTLAVKYHPKFGRIEELESLNLYEIPAYLPGELIDYSEVCGIIGLSSAAISFPSKLGIKCLSLIELCEATDLYWLKNYVKNLTENKITFNDIF